ncbi:MAG: helix-turn-helix domain-containing protein [Terracidiphilus sp.]
MHPARVKEAAERLNVTPSLASKWERGEKHPQGASLKLLSLVEKKGLEIVARWGSLPGFL